MMKYVVPWNRRSTPALVIAGLLSGTCAFAGANEALVELRLVAREDDPAPGLPGFNIYSLYSAGPSISASGHVAFRGRVTSTRYAMWSGLPGDVQLMALQGTQATGLPTGVLYGEFFASEASIDAQGRVGFWSYLQGTGVPSNQGAAFWGASGAVSSLLREGSPVPWPSSGVSAGNDVAPPYLGGGTAVLSASTSAGFGIWQTTQTGLQLIVREGASASGTPAGTLFSTVNMRPPRPLVNSRGEIAFIGGLTGAGTQPSTNAGVWAGPAGAFQLAARRGSNVSGLGTGVTLTSLEHLAWSDAGAVAFQGNLAGVASGTGEAVWWGGPGDVRLIARTKSQAPGAPNGVFYDSFTFTYPMLAGDFIGYMADLGGPGVTSANDYAFFVGRRDSVTMVLREGDQVPGMAPGVVFTDLFDRFAMNARGQIAFCATIAGPGITSNNDTGIWATDTRGNLHQLARQGTPLVAQLPSGGTATLTFTSARLSIDSSGEDGRSTGINAAGQVAFLATPAPTPGKSAIIRADIIEPCTGDFDGDGFLSFDDFDAFVAAFEAGATSSDITGDGFLDFEDFDAFVAAFEAGCA